MTNIFPKINVHAMKDLHTVLLSALAPSTCNSSVWWIPFLANPHTMEVNSGNHQFFS